MRGPENGKWKLEIENGKWKVEGRGLGGPARHHLVLTISGIYLARHQTQEFPCTIEKALLEVQYVRYLS